MITGQELALELRVDISTINNYVKRGMPYKLGIINKIGTVNRNIRLFDKEISMDWIYRNGSVKLLNSLSLTK